MACSRPGPGSARRERVRGAARVRGGRPRLGPRAAPPGAAAVRPVRRPRARRRRLRPARRLARHAGAPTAGEPGMTAPDQDRPAELRVRIPRINLFAVAVAAVCTVPLAFASPWLAILWLLPIAGLLHVLRTGVDADATGLTTHTLFGSRRLAWDDIAGLRIRRSRIGAVLRNGSTVRLPVLRPRHLSLLSAASGGRLPDPTAGAAAAPSSGGQSGAAAQEPSRTTFSSGSPATQ